MDFLFSSNILTDYSLRTAIETFAEEGVTGIEIWVEHLWKEESSLCQLRQLLDSLKLNRTLHAPTRDINITSSNPGIRGESVSQTFEALEIAKELGAEVVTIHPGHMSSSKDTPRDYFGEHVEIFQSIGTRARSLELKVAIEVMEKKPLELITTPDQMNALLEKVDMDCVGTTFDIAHAASCFKNSVDEGKLNHRIVEYMKNLKKIFNVHISNASREKVHLPLLRGEYDFLPVLKELASFYEGSVTIEGFAPGDGMRVMQENKTVTAKWKERLADAK